MFKAAGKLFVKLAQVNFTDEEGTTVQKWVGQVSRTTEGGRGTQQLFLVLYDLTSSFSPSGTSHSGRGRG